MSGRETISTSGTPQRLKSTRLWPGSAPPPGASCRSLPASSSRWRRSTRTCLSDCASGTSPFSASGRSNWLI